MTQSGVCCRCNKKSKDLVWSESKQGMVCYPCSGEIWKEKKEMLGLP